MKGLLLSSGLVAAGFLSAPVAAAPSPLVDADKVACVPVRDSANRPTGRQLCRTAEQWVSILRKQGHFVGASPSVPPFNQLHDYGFRSARR